MYIYSFSKINKATGLNFGGKADSLSILIRNGFPVPDGYAIASEAFENEKLKNDAETELTELIASLSEKYTYAVRSSAVGEDGQENSFAGAYETILNVKKSDVMQAVYDIVLSAESERVDIYAENRNCRSGNIAVIIQKYIEPEYAGVIFTADTITASSSSMTGQYVRGAGEKLVSGNGSDGSFRINTVKYSYDGPSEFRKYAKKLYRLAAKAADLYSCQLDIEWAVSENRLFILQARPITTMFRNNRSEFLINDSLCGEYLLSKTNVGEIFQRPVSPATYGMISMITDLFGIPFISNVSGQMYLNISSICSVLVSFGVSPEKALKMISELSGGIPENINVPVFRTNRKELIKKLLTLASSSVSKGKNKRSDDTMVSLTDGSETIINEIRSTENGISLSELWKNRCEPFMKRSLGSIVKGVSLKTLFSSRAALEKMCSPELADRLLSDCSENGNIESTGILLALEDVISGKISAEEYKKRFGHRHANEMELSEPYPYEDINFPENAVSEYINSGMKAREMKKNQEKRRDEAIEEFKKINPKKYSKMLKLLSKYSKAVQSRETVRSDALRIFCIIREFYLKAGSISGLGNDIFMLYHDEVIKLMSEKSYTVSDLEKRKINYNSQMNYDNFPNIIYGRFTEEEWRNSGCPAGYYRYGEMISDDDIEIISGVPGSCGTAEGKARIIKNINEADSMQNGEILIVPAANVGWIKLFPKAAALVTDIGAPLSHAVIVARELGIPAVVSCFNASGTIKNGEYIKVDGTSGKIIRNYKK